MQITLTKPLSIDGQTHTKLELNLENLTGYDMIKAEQDAMVFGDKSENVLFSSTGVAIIAAKASGLKPEDIFQTSAPDFMVITNTVRNFLFGWALLMGMQSEV